MSALNQVNTVGKLYTYYKMIPLICLGCVLLSVGVGIGVYPDPYRGNKVTGKVLELNTPCVAYVKTIQSKKKDNPNSQRTETWYRCDAKYAYIVGGVVYNHDKVFDAPKATAKGEDLKINYDPSDPNKHQINYVNTMAIASVVSGIGLCMFCIALIIIMTVKNVKGAGTLYMAKNVTNRVLR
jgi:hypothetical protein